MTDITVSRPIRRYHAAPGLSIETLSTSFTFQESADQLTVYHKVQVPKIE